MTEPANAGVEQGLPIDLDDFRREMREQDLEELVEEIVDAFVEDAPGRMEALNAAVSSSEADTIRSAAHAYKSAAATMRANRLAELLQQTEAAAREGNVSTPAELLPQVQQEHDAAMAQLQQVSG